MPKAADKSVTFAMPYGQYGGAQFAICKPMDIKRRRFLWRAWMPAPMASVSRDDMVKLDEGQWDKLSLPYALFIGHNPSNADAMRNDMTIIRETFFCRQLERSILLKLNISDICATDPAELDNHRIVVEKMNLDMIAKAARSAADILFVSGVPHRSITGATELVMRELIRVYGDRPKCLGLTATGWPRHPSRIHAAAPILSLAKCLSHYDRTGKNV